MRKTNVPSGDGDGDVDGNGDGDEIRVAGPVVPKTGPWVPKPGPGPGPGPGLGPETGSLGPENWDPYV